MAWWRFHAPSTLGVITRTNRCPALLGEHAVIQHAGAVEHAAHGIPRPAEPVHDARHGLGFAHVDLLHVHAGAGLLHPRERLAC